MKYVIHDHTRMSIYAEYDSESAATRSLTNAREKGWKIQGRKYPKNTLQNLSVVSMEEFNAADTEVTVTNIISGEPVQIKQSQVGGPCDPSTERYWSM